MFTKKNEYNIDKQFATYIPTINNVNKFSYIQENFKSKNNKMNKRNKYYFYTIQKAVEPKVLCKGYLELGSNNMPNKISFKIAPINTYGRLGKPYTYRIIGKPQVLSGKAEGALLFKYFYEVNKPDTQSQLTEFRISPDRKQFNISLKPAPLPWGDSTCLRSIVGIGADGVPTNFLGINIKNDDKDGFEDWFDLPPIPKT